MRWELLLLIRPEKGINQIDLNFNFFLMMQSDYLQMMKGLNEERERIRNNPAAARELLDSLGLTPFLVPKGTCVPVEYPIDAQSEEMYLKTMLYVFLCN
jgi:hypothetical protein